jgi:competence protein ComEA
MNRRFKLRFLTALAVCVPLAAGAAKPASAPAKGASAPAKPASAPQATAPIDINSASPETLKTLPGVGDAEAAKIVAGRPYHSKADLVTKKILPMGVYGEIKGRIVAMQKSPPASAATGKKP